jgi:periplasmic protein TonB
MATDPAVNAADGTGILTYVEPPADGIVDEKTVFNGNLVQEQALFKGGSVDNFRGWLMKKIRYPEEAYLNGIKGMVVVKFTVGRDGKVCDVMVEKGIHPLIDGAVVKALQSSPDWTPAKMNGKTVKVFYHIPVKFDLKPLGF